MPRRRNRIIRSESCLLRVQGAKHDGRPDNQNGNVEDHLSDAATSLADRHPLTLLHRKFSDFCQVKTHRGRIQCRWIESFHECTEHLMEHYSTCLVPTLAVKHASQAESAKSDRPPQLRARGSRRTRPSPYMLDAFLVIATLQTCHRGCDQASMMA